MKTVYPTQTKFAGGINYFIFMGYLKQAGGGGSTTDIENPKVRKMQIKINLFTSHNGSARTLAHPSTGLTLCLFV